ncbi:Colicin I receptor (plasmid) [Fibrella aestuarina BUZ 2]|uniref:Colicin I receptor n=1 Tax=Fibrella aestuarina BUZ 2 TaxID=1166018 RepID=I0KHN1_9BACT|nr:TonB-dependent receptor [Fibrella aestuarina]CCH03634.1 Colicin I receptor [Fibrella aestuarina BUZ 2]
MRQRYRLFYGVIAYWLTLLAAHAQAVRLQVEDSLTRQPLVGATVRVESTPPTGTATDATGQATLPTLKPGVTQLTVSLVGYKNYPLRLTLPLDRPDSLLLVRLAPAEAALDEVVVTATRTNRRIEDLPIKVEVLGQEDMDEEAAVVPGNVGSILGDISIIHVQRTSLTTGNQGIRMQGLDPKYTQILRDGLPLFEGFSGNLGVLQIPPLDLKQVEIVKGSASTLYGGGAIGGLLNLVSRRPGPEPELTAVLNRSSLRETNLNAYYAQQWNPKIGMTLFSGYTDQPAIDVNGDGFADVPLIKQFTLHPRLFLTPTNGTRLNVGYTLVDEKRTGGDVAAINGTDAARTYVVGNNSLRHTVDATLDRQFTQTNTLTARGTLSFFDRTQVDNGYRFAGRQLSGYAEVVDYLEHGPHAMVAGANLTLEQFRKGLSDSTQITDYTYQTLGIFVQDDYTLGKVTFQGGLRLDYHNVFGTFFLPRLSMLVKPSTYWSIRTSIGTGYKTPNTFANLTGADARTSLSYRYLLPINTGTRPERSLGLNMDIAYHGTIGEHLTVQLDQAFYYTTISNPVVAVTGSNTATQTTVLQNAAYDIRSLGTDTYLRLEYDAVEFYLGYNHTSVRRTAPVRQGNDITAVGANTFLPYSPRDKFSFTLAYSIPDQWRWGIETSWVGNQYLYDNGRVPNYWFWAAAIERMFGKVSLVLNAENLFNVQQIQFGPVVTGPRNNPSIAPLWAPQEGRIVNLALRYKLKH